LDQHQHTNNDNFSNPELHTHPAKQYNNNAEQKRDDEDSNSHDVLHHRSDHNDVPLYGIKCSVGIVSSAIWHIINYIIVLLVFSSLVCSSSVEAIADYVNNCFHSACGDHTKGLLSFQSVDQREVVPCGFFTNDFS
jgi:hypothetical protein